MQEVYGLLFIYIPHEIIGAVSYIERFRRVTEIIIVLRRLLEDFYILLCSTIFYFTLILKVIYKD